MAILYGEPVRPFGPASWAEWRCLPEPTPAILEVSAAGAVDRPACSAPTLLVRVRSNGAGRFSQAMPSLSLSRPSGSFGLARRWAWASAWDARSEQSWSPACASAAGAAPERRSRRAPSADEEARLYQHFGLPYGPVAGGAGPSGADSEFIAPATDKVGE